MTSTEHFGSKFDKESDPCDLLLEAIAWTDIKSIATLVFLMFIDLVVICGNTMVIMAVYYTTKLRSVTNLFIVSLAVSDLLVGVLVLPFSAMWEVYKVSGCWNDSVFSIHVVLVVTVLGVGDGEL